MVEGHVLLLDAPPGIRSPSKARSRANGVKVAGFIRAQNVKTRSIQSAEPIERVIIVLGPFENPVNPRNILDWNKESAEISEC